MDAQEPDGGVPGRSARIVERLGPGGLTALGAGVVAGIALLVMGIASNPPPPSTTTSPDTTAPTAAGPLVAPIDSCGLLADDEIDHALGLVDEEGNLRANAVLTAEQGEGCRWEAEIRPSGDMVYLEVGPGDPTDFTPQTRLLDEAGVEHGGVGDLALWFPGVGAGVMSSVVNTSNGYLFVRVEIGRAEVDDPTRRRLAAELTEDVLDRIRFGPPEPVEIDLCQLISDDSAERYLAPHRDGRPGARDGIFGGGSPKVVDLTQDGDISCQKLILAEIYLTSSMGRNSDFATDARLEGVRGRPVLGVGDEAVYFADVPSGDGFAADHETDVIAVRSGNARFRIVAALPDLSAQSRRAAVVSLAHEALSRLPEGLPVTFSELEPPDVSVFGFADNLEARVADGEWTLGEGLVSTLRLFVGEVGAGQVLRDPDIANQSGTEIIRMARAYADTGPDAGARAEIERLLGLIAPPPYVDLEPATRRAPSGMTVALRSMPLVQADEEESDGGYAPPPDLPEDDPYLPPPDDQVAIDCSFGPEPGWDAIPLYAGSDGGSDHALLFIPQSGLTPGWTQTHVTWTGEAVQKSIDLYSPSATPCLHVVLSVHGGASTWVLDTNASGVCGVFINTPMQTWEEGPFKQEIARALAHCIIPLAWPQQLGVASFLNRRWWNHALAEFLSNIVYPGPTCQAGNGSGGRCDLEWRHNAALAALELSHPMLQRHDQNWVFFQQVWLEVGMEGVLRLVEELPGSGQTFDHERALAALDGIDEFFHQFVQRLTDVAIEDAGGGPVPYSPPSERIPVAGAQVIPRTVEPFGTTRLHLEIDPGKVACIRAEAGDRVMVTYREGRPGPFQGSWLTMPEDATAFSGEFVVVATTTAPEGDLTITVEDVREDDHCEDDSEPDSFEGSDPECVDICGPSRYYRDPADVDDDLRDRVEDDEDDDPDDP